MPDSDTKGLLNNKPGWKQLPVLGEPAELAEGVPCGQRRDLALPGGRNTQYVIRSSQINRIVFLSRGLSVPFTAKPR
jgi:hypothetical protein